MEECCKDGKMEEGACCKDGGVEKCSTGSCGSAHGKWCHWVKVMFVGLGVAAIVLSWLKAGGSETLAGMDSDHLLWNGMALLLISKACGGCRRKKC